MRVFELSIVSPRSIALKVSYKMDELKRATNVIWRIYREAPTNAINSSVWMFLENWPCTLINSWESIGRNVVHDGLIEIQD